MSSECFGSEAVRKTFTDHFNQTLYAIISDTRREERLFHGKHLENIFGLCKSFASSGILRIRLSLAWIILRYCMVSPNYVPLDSENDEALEYALILFYPDDWEKGYKSIMDLKSRIERSDASILYPIPQIRMKQNIGNNQSETETEQWFPEAIDMDPGIDDSNSNEIWTEDLREDFNDIILRIHVMQALSYFVRRYVFEGDEEEVEDFEIAQYHSFVMGTFQGHHNLLSSLLSILEDPTVPSPPKSRTTVRNFLAQNCDLFDLIIFQEKLDQFCKKVNNLLPPPGVTANLGVSSQQKSADNISFNEVGEDSSGEQALPLNEMGDHFNLMPHSTNELESQRMNNSTALLVGNNDKEVADVESSKQCVDDRSIYPTLPRTANQDEVADVESTKQNVDDQSIPPTLSRTEDDHESLDQMERSVRDLQEKRSQLMSNIRVDPLVMSQTIASQAMIRAQCDLEDIHDTLKGVNNLDWDSSTTKISASVQERDDDSIRETNTSENRNDESKLHTEQHVEQDDQSKLYGTKRSRSQLQWNGLLDDNSANVDQEERTTKIIKVEHKPRKKPEPFSEEEKDAIKNGAKDHGVGKWALIKNDIRYKDILKNRTSVQIKDCWRTMVNRSEV